MFKERETDDYENNKFLATERSPRHGLMSILKTVYQGLPSTL